MNILIVKQILEDGVNVIGDSARWLICTVVREIECSVQPTDWYICIF